MKRSLYLPIAALMTLLILAPAAVAQDEEVEEAAGQPEEIETPAEEAAEEPVEEALGIDIAEEPQEEAVEEAAQEGAAVIEQTIEVEREATVPLPPSGGPGIGGGPAVILPAAAALLLGSGVLAYAILRRR